MTTDQDRDIYRPIGSSPENNATSPGDESSIEVEDVAEPTFRIRKWMAGTVGVLFIVAAITFAVWPYERGLVGYLDGDREVVRTDCGAPITAALSERTSNVLAGDGTWAEDPPCQRTAAFRLGLAGLIGAVGLVALTYAALQHRRSTRQRSLAAQSRGEGPVLHPGS